ncbi:PilN domain-containing protein [Pseudomonas sp. SA3-5]|uniref:PilN domain-containing protein n=1 Tax=Pseudomonas aestuarii TaxID=3018340 RepID=A0ABT4XFH3_9PSED|nr:PilN domain-containing protein [Pseudomonas aestuarii]MDA7086940.1 PilN domain-containing protein [Pseudomonas aestuarii]
MNNALQVATDSVIVMAQRFWQWWRGELLGLIPAQWRERLRRRGNLLFVILHQDQCSLAFGSFSQHETLVSMPLGEEGEWPPALVEALLARETKASQVILLLPEQKVLRKVLSLPAATEAGLSNVLRFEMDRHTPFTAEQVYFGYRILERDRRHQRLQVELLVVPREYLDQLLRRLEALAVHPTLVTLAEDDARRHAQPINLLPGGLLRKRGGWRGNRRLQIAALVALVALAALPLWQQQQRAERLASELGAPKAAAERAAAVRDELKRLEAGRAYLYEQQAQADDVLNILNELTLLLPDSTWLSRFELTGERVRLEGESAEASALIGLFEQSKTLQNVTYASPITSNPRTEKDRFSLIAERRPAEEAP